MLSPKFGTVKSYYKNQIIFKEGQMGNAGYLIKEGQVAIYKILDDKKKILNTLGPGEIFGEMGIVTESPRNAFAEATEYCDLVIIDKDTIFKMLKQSPKLIQSITLFLMKRLSSTLEMLDKKDDDNSQISKTMISIASLLDLMVGQDKQINYNAFCLRAADIADLDQAEIDLVIQKLTDLKVIEVSGEFQKAKTSDCTITVFDSKGLLNSVKR